MAIKDLDTGENIDRNRKEAENKKGKSHPDHEGPADGKASGETIKNANATGTGSMGRNESSLPEEDAAGNKTEGPVY